MSKVSAKNVKLDDNNLKNSLTNISLNFLDSQPASTDTVWSSEKIKTYIDQIAQGLDPKESCRASTTGDLPSVTYDNGTSGVGATLTSVNNQSLPSQDGVSLTVGDRLLVKDQSDATQNGIYKVTNLGSTSSKFILTRTEDYDDSPDGEVTSGAYCFIEEGAVNAHAGFILTTNNPITIGTSNLTYSKFSGTGQVTAGVGLDKETNTINVGLNGFVGNRGGITRSSSDIGIATAIGVEVSGELLRIASTAAGEGLTGGSGTALSVETSEIVGDGLEENGNNIQIAHSAAGDGLKNTIVGVLDINTPDFAGTGLESVSNDLRIGNLAAGDGLQGGSGSALAVQPDSTGGTNLAKVVNASVNGVAIRIDDTSIGEDNNNRLYIKEDGITENQLNSSVAGDGLQGGGGSPLAIKVDDFAGEGLEENSGDLRIASSAAGNGLTGGSGSALAVQSDSTGGANLAKVINVVSSGVNIKVDDASIEENSANNQLRVKDNGITPTQINTSVAGTGLSGGAGSALAINVDTLITAGAAEIDGDKLNISWVPTYYTRATMPAECDDVSNLTAHLYGIDQAFLDFSDEKMIQEMHLITAGEESNGYFDLYKIPVNDQSVRVTVYEANMQINNAVNIGTGEIPDFEMINLSQLHFNNNGSASGLSELIEAGDVLIIEYQYEIETGKDANGDLMPYIGEPENANNIFEENGPASIMPTTSGTEHEYFEIIDGEIVPKE